MKARKFHAFVLAGLITLLTPFGQVARAGGAATPPAEAARLATTPVMAVDASKANAAALAIDASKVSDEVRQQTQEKAALQERLRQVSSAGGARVGEPVDGEQVSVKEPVSRGELKLAPDTAAGFAYVQPYAEPDDYAHRNYCGPGAATVLLSHWDPGYPGQVNIDDLGRRMDLDPNSGVWIRDIVGPVNEELSVVAGAELNWYRYGKAQTLDDFRTMLDVDLNQNGVPLITGLMTKGLPGWGEEDVGHIVAVYGYSRDADGREWVTYADTAPAASGYEGAALQTVDMGTFWHAVSGNSAQVW